MNIPAEMAKRLTTGSGFFAALDQSGGSTPSALRAYGVPDAAYHDSDEMFALMHAMPVSIMTAPAFMRRAGGSRSTTVSSRAFPVRSSATCAWP